MATTQGRAQCEKCYRPQEAAGLEQHNPGCPDIDGAPASWMAEWKKGRNFGFADNYPHWWMLRSVSRSYALGWRVGYDEISDLVEAAAERNYEGDQY